MVDIVKKLINSKLNKKIKGEKDKDDHLEENKDLNGQEALKRSKCLENLNKPCTIIGYG